jgi:RHS repeat-associated protein
VGVSTDTDNLADFYQATVLSATDYYAFGMSMKERSWQSDSYRYGFNGKENDADWDVQDYGFRIYKPEISKFLSVDPLTQSYPELTPYQFASNSPISGIDLDGLEYLLYLYSPDISNKYQGVTNIKTQSESDIYRQREITYWALTHQYTAESEKFLREKGIDKKVAELKYDKTAPQGVTVIMFDWDAKTGKLVEEARHTVPPNRLDGQRPFDAYYPVDIYLEPGNDYYSSWDFQGTYEEKGVGLFYGRSEGNIKGHLKGYGYIELETFGEHALFGGMISASKGSIYGSYRGSNAGTPNNYSGDSGAVGIATPIGELFYNWGKGEGVSDGKLWKGYQSGLGGIGAIFEWALFGSKTKATLTFPQIKNEPKNEKEWNINTND